MKNLIIDFKYRNPEIKLKGLGVKNSPKDVYKEDTLQLAIDTNYGGYNGKSKINGNTARIEEDYLIYVLSEIYEEIPFDGIKTKGHYHLSGNEIYNKVILFINRH